MSASTRGDLSLINDEDVLRKMWQDTDDFGRKKEIRTHMYKIREARLKDFYNSADVNTEIKRTESKSFNKSTHADSLADHSFLSLKSKEIRDSESPTRDCTFKITGVDKHNDQGWTVVTSNEQSEDGKTHVTKRLAQTSGSQKIDGGKVDYAAKNEQKSVVYQDGDDKNFTKSVGAASNTVIQQEAVGGDANSSFKTSSTKTTSSSRVVSEHKSTSGDVIKPHQQAITEQGTTVQKQIYTSNAPSDVRNHPSYVEGKTKVIRETKTLPDGTTVTTTRYETKGGATTTSNQYSSTSEQRSSSSQQVSSSSEQRSSSTIKNSSDSQHRVAKDQTDNVKAVEYYKDDHSRQNKNIIQNKNISQNIQVERNQHHNQDIKIRTDVQQNQQDVKIIRDAPTSNQDVTYITKKTKTITNHMEPVVTTTHHHTTVVEDNKKIISDQFINQEKHQQEKQTFVSPQQKEPSPERKRKEPKESYGSPERRQPIRPGKSEMDQKLEPTEGQYDTTYRAEFTPKRISVEVSPTHDAFARSLRAVSPDRFSKCSSPSRGSVRSLRTSTTSLRSSTSPEKNRHPSRYSPERNRSTSPKKATSSDTFTYTTVTRRSPERRRHEETNTDTITRRNTSTTVTSNREIDSSTLTRRKKTPRSRTPSPTSIASDIEYIRNAHDIVTDLDATEDVTIKINREVRPSSLEITTTTKKTKKVTDRSPTSPISTKKSPPRRSSLKSPTKEQSPTKYYTSAPINGSPTKDKPKDRILKRTDTYEERCKQILGIASQTNTDTRRSSLDKVTKTTRKSPEKSSPDYSTPYRRSSEKEPKRKSPTKSGVSEFPAQVRKSVEREPLGKYPEKKSPTKTSPTIGEFPSQIRRSPEKEPLGPYPGRKSPSKTAPTISEFPSQVRRSPEKEPLGPYPGRKSPTKTAPTISEFPSQIKKTPEREPLERYPEKKSPTKTGPSVSEFPAQTRRPVEKEQLGDYPERKSPTKVAPNIAEFPSQIRRSPEREPLEPYPEKQSPKKTAPSIGEFPSQIRRSPEREPLESYPERKSPTKSAPTIGEFPSQIRKSPEREPLEPYPERKVPSKTSPSVSEFPSQIRKSPEKEPLEPYPERKSPTKTGPSVSEFPSQIRRSPEREPLEPYPERRTPSKTAPGISEFPSQTRRSPSEDYPGKTPERERDIITYPTSGKPKLKKPKATTGMSSDSSSEEETQVDEISTVTNINKVEQRIPVNEPLFTKKFIDVLCREEEIQRTDTRNKKTTEELLESEIIQDETTKRNISTTVKKDQAKNQVIKKRGTDEFIKNEKQTTVTETTKVKKPVVEKVPTKKTDTVTKTTKTTQHDSSRIAKSTKKPNEKITLYDVDNLSDTEQDNSVHIRTHRIDTTTTSTNKIVNGDVKKPKAKPVPKREPITKKTDTVTKLDHNKQRGVNTTVTTKKTFDVKTTVKKPTITTTVTVTPKTKTTTTKTVLTARVGQTKLGKTPTKPKKLQNGHVSSDTEDDSVVDSLEGITVDVTTKKTTSKTDQKITRTTSDQIIRNQHKVPTRGMSKPELISGNKPRVNETTPSSNKPKKLEKKCISTKSIIINNTNDERDIVVDLQRSTSSREPTPDRIWPRAVSSEEDTGTPRYPDQVLEPDDSSLKRKPKKLTDMPLMEDDTCEFTRITDITEATSKITEVDKVEETDESLLSVNSKISKFLHTADKLTKQPTKPSGPAPKVARPKLVVSDDLKSDECLLSVSDKVTKFISTAEELITPQQQLDNRPKSPKCLNYSDVDETEDTTTTRSNVSDKVTRFTATTDDVTTSKTRAPKIPRPDLTDVDERIKDDECLLSVSDKVTKFVSTADKLKTVSLAKIDIDSRGTKKTTEDIRPSPTRKSSSPEDQRTPTRRPSNEYSSVTKTETETKYCRRDSSPKFADSTPKSTRPDDSKIVLSSTGRLRSTESIKRAKALFENINKEPSENKPRQRDILSRPSVFEGRRQAEEKKTTSTKTRLDYSNEEQVSLSSIRKDDSLKSTKLVLDKMYPRAKSPDRPRVYDRERESSPESDVPGYMRPLDRSLRPNSPHRDSIIKSQIEDKEEKTKFGVSLRTTETNKTDVVRNEERRKSSITLEKRVTEEEVEDIYDLEILEELLEKVVGYELRRKIRAQIRLVKKLISENKLETYISKKDYRNEVHKTEYPTKVTKRTSPERRVSSSDYNRTEYQTSYSSERRTSSEVTRRSQSPETKPTRAKSPEKPTKRPSPERKTSHKVQDTTTSTTNKTFTSLKKTTPVTKTVTNDNKPEWAKQRINLRKTTETAPVVKKTTTTTSTVRKQSNRTSPAKDPKPTDLITSSYGVGPTDENGTPLFGLRALRAQNNRTDTTTKVQGTVVRSQYYSKNGEEPVGQISVTKYSSDPRDLTTETGTNNKGLTSVTTTQKFGYKDTPTLRSLTTDSKKKQICDSTDESVTTKTSSKVTRRGSVKALSQKFIENAVETLKSEKQTSYPRAGLILRTSSFKDGHSTDSSREGSPVNREMATTVRTTSSKSSTVSGGESFLTNKSKVTGVRDVISRMKAEETVAGDSEEDAKARGLLNKFLGAQVILSGIETSQHTASKTTTSSSSSPVTTKRTTKITTTVTEGGKPTTKTRVFQRPITEQELETVWDEQTLRLLLEQSTDYEERRIIRARLRQVMAEQEACADLVEKASQEQSGGAIEEKVLTSTRTFKQGPVTTTQVTTRVTQQQQLSKKPISPFAKFRQLDKQNSLNTPPSTPKTPSGSGPLFKFTDPALSQSASTIKDRLLYWCRMKTKEYENIQLDNFSTSWADGLAFCALIHHFLPDAFDYHALTPKERRHNFTLAFQIADEKADIAPLLDVDDMVATRKPDWKCVFTYVQSIYRRFKDDD